MPPGGGVLQLAQHVSHVGVFLVGHFYCEGARLYVASRCCLDHCDLASGDGCAKAQEKNQSDQRQHCHVCVDALVVGNAMHTTWILGRPRRTSGWTPREPP